ncbi:hypothetical protein LBMAG18_01530 [Alphaproteobacteria bacterium]|nr:hypothetical protein LBMAG18_01530 [Alphaproteobacteria bacterium]
MNNSNSTNGNPNNSDSSDNNENNGNPNISPNYTENNGNLNNGNPNTDTHELPRPLVQNMTMNQQGAVDLRPLERENMVRIQDMLRRLDEGPFYGRGGK